jgi:hypothetical protein
MAKRKSSNSSGKGPTSPSVDLLKSINQGPSPRALRVGPSGDLTRLQVGGQLRAKPIQFGSASDKAAKNSSTKKSGSTWMGLLESVSTGGLSDLLGGGGLLSTGLDYVNSGLQGIFGAGSNPVPEPLSRFSLPDSQDQSIYVDGPQTATEAKASSNISSGLYDNSQSSRLSQLTKTEIVQTVKNAILTSSSLNDVIGEL